MATEQDSATPSLRSRLPADPALLGVLAFALVGLVARLYDLGARVMHWDEGRVGFGILRYAETGAWEYRPIVHGPFLPQVNRVVFGVFGASDFTARLVVALVGAALPLVALLFRGRLRDSEVVALAGLLALNPILLYYSRFMRNDLLVGAFMLFALGFLVRAVDTGNPWHVYAASGSFALGFTTKENAVLYALCFAGGAALLLDHRLLLATSRRLGRQVRAAVPAGDRGPDAESPEVATTDGGTADGGEAADADTDGGTAVQTGAHPPGETVRWDVWVRSFLGDVSDRLGLWWPVLLIAVAEFLLVLIFFYAPRGAAGPDGVGLYGALGQPAKLPAIVEEALLGSWEKLSSTWIEGSHQDHAYLPYFEHYVGVIRATAMPLAAFAVVGFLADRYSPDGPRDLVALGGYWGFVSVLGYPLVTDLQAGWTVVHAVVPLALPAAVGVALVYRWGYDAFADDDVVGVALAAVILLLVATSGVSTAVDVTYDRPTDPDNELVQFGQPEAEMAGTLDDVAALSSAHDGPGPDVLFYGSHFYVENESEAYRLPIDNNPGRPGGAENNGNWYNRLPLPWYTEAAGSEVDSVRYEQDLPTALSDRPPVVITRLCSEYWNQQTEKCVGNNNAADVREVLGDGYVERQHQLTAPGTRTVVFLRADLLDGAGG